MGRLARRFPKKIVLALSGVMLGFTIIFAKVGALAYCVLVPLAFVLFAKTEFENYKLKQAYADGFAFYMGFDLVALHWLLYFYPLEFLGFSKLQALGVVLLAWIGLSFLQCAFSAFVFVGIAAFSKTAIFKRMPLLLAPFAAALFTINEWTQTFTWAGVPWARIAISQTEMPIMMQSASLFGSYFLTFIIVSFNFLLAYAILHKHWRRLASVCAACVLLGNLLVGTVLYFIPNVDSDEPLEVAAVQINKESQSSIDTSAFETLAICVKQTRLAAEQGAEVVIWPEGSPACDINAIVKGDNGKFDSLKDHLSALAQELGITVISGNFIIDQENKTMHNSLSVFYPDGDSDIGAYSKRKLVPFGEYVPMREVIELVLPVLTQLNYFASDSTPGTESTSFGATSKDDAIKIGPMICFDSIYEKMGLDTARAGAQIMMVTSNDSWFYDSRALNMHHSQNILRAVEQGKYTISCGNTGISSIVTDKGDIVEQIPIYTEGYVLGTVYPSSARTLYSYVGNLFVYLCIAFAVASFGSEIYFKKKKR